ncbi:MAG: acyl carrier protein [Prevotellaceae bacterium]|nr:acyl carrier protein [Candidatus Minthosoma caballi]
MNDDATPIYYDEQNIEIDEETFRKKYGKEFDKIIAAGFEEIDSRIANNSVYNNLSSYDGDVSVSSRIKTIVAETLNVSPYDVVENASFTNDLGADSLDAVELIMRFEKEFGLNIPDEVAERIQTVGDAIIYIGRHYR